MPGVRIVTAQALEAQGAGNARRNAQGDPGRFDQQGSAAAEGIHERVLGIPIGQRQHASGQIFPQRRFALVQAPAPFEQGLARGVQIERGGLLEQKQVHARIIGYDIDPAAIEFSKRNAERAWLAEDAIRFEVRDARQAERVAETGWIVTNPPYGDRLENSDPALWQDWSGTLKHQFAGWNLHVITSDMAFPQQLRLKPRRRTPIYNGGIECRLFGFELVEAGFRGE
ncbi:MAG: hypothetical protein EON54_24265 [Alcaligenaceae bacterium]|nr:MAG: hypothetical protein EON54_24265 [Alcaligenaceae bacterium]